VHWQAVADRQAGWKLVGFAEWISLWEKNEETPGDLVLLVADWIVGRHTDPYSGVQREPGFDNLWFGHIPNTFHGDGLVVCCSYWITETDRVVQCDSIASLHWPV
jgi:hypothetical protein